MEISALAVFLTPFLPFFLKLEKDAADAETESVANQFGEVTWQKAQAIWAAIGSNLEEKESAREAAIDVANNPDDEDAQGSLRNQLKKLLANDKTLANKLARILAEHTEDNSLATQVTQNVKGNQNQTIGQISSGQVFGNITGSVSINGSGNSDLEVKTILVLAANPKGTNPLRLGEEVREIQSGLDRSKYRDRFCIEQRWAVRPRDVQRALLDTRPQIVHFSGHGFGSASASDNRRKAIVLSTDAEAVQAGAIQTESSEPEGLLFEDETGGAKLVSADAVAHLFSLFSDEVNCVILNACYSATQAAAIAQYIPYVVGMKKAIGDRAAIKFSLGFYDGLLSGRSVEFAYNLGCNAIELESIPEHLTPVLKKNA